MKVKSYSLIGKMAIGVMGMGCCFLKWFDIMPNATITEIWSACGMMYGIMLGTVDLNICGDARYERHSDDTREP